MIEIFEGIGFGSHSGSIFKALDIPGYGPEGSAAAQPPAVRDYSTTMWSPWGSDNLQPVTMADHIEHCGVLFAALDAKARIAAGGGVDVFFKMDVQDGKEQLEWCSDKEIQDWLDENNMYETQKELAYDATAYGWNAGTMILNRGRDRINKIRRLDVYEARLAKRTAAQRFSSDLFLCSDWATGGTSYDTSKHVRIPLLQDGNEYNDLTERTASNVFEFAFTNRLRRNGRQYYPMPLWFANEAWVKVVRSIPAYKNAIFKNQIVLRYVVTIHPQYWADNVKDWITIGLDPVKRQTAQKAVYDRIDQWLAGENNAGKSLFNGGFFEKATGKFVPYIQVEAIDDKFKDGKLLPDSAAGNSEILFATMINPALMGAGQPGGPYSNNAGGSNVRESYLVQMMLMDAERKMNTRMMNVVKKFNGWSSRLEVATNRTITSTGLDGQTQSTTSSVVPRLVFRFQSNLLTTLDTGKSTKPETVG